MKTETHAEGTAAELKVLRELANVLIAWDSKHQGNIIPVEIRRSIKEVKKFYELQDYDKRVIL
jgi:hypothetical protein